MEQAAPPLVTQEMTPQGDYSRYGLLTMAALWAVETVLPLLGQYRTLATGLLYIAKIAPLLYLSLSPRQISLATKTFSQTRWPGPC